MFHAKTVADLMRELDYPEEMIQRAQTIMSKRHLHDDPETQTLEDALCLVFLQTQLTDLRQKTPDDKMKGILKKTWVKMSARGRAAAFQLPLSDEERRWIAEVVSVDPAQ